MSASTVHQAMVSRRPVASAACVRLAVAALSAALLGACVAGDRARAGGIADHDADALPRLELHETLRIGSVDDPDTGFARIGSVDVDRDGRIYVFENQDLHLRVYEPDGSHVRTIGRRGQGPGEFTSAAPRFGVVGDTIWSFEQWSGRLTLFARDGSVLAAHRWSLAQVPTQVPGQTRVVMPYWMLPGGRFVGGPGGALNMGPGGTPSQDTLWLPRLLFDVTGAVLDTLGLEVMLPPDGAELDIVDIGSSQYLRPVAPSAIPRSELLSDGRAIIDRPVATDAAGAVFRVTRVDFAGDTLADRTFSYTPAAFPSAVLDTAIVRAVRSTNGPMMVMMPAGVTTLSRRLPEDSAAAHRALLASLAFPPFQPPVSSARLAADDGLWLRREDDGGPTFRWIVLDSALRPLGEVAVPRGQRIEWSRGHEVIGVETDELGVPWLVKYELREAGR